MHSEQTAGFRVLTIGHSNHALEHFLELLKQRSVAVVVDTRSHPYSNYATHYDQQPLIYLGKELLKARRNQPLLSSAAADRQSVNRTRDCGRSHSR